MVRVKKDRVELEENLAEVMLEIKTDKEKVNKIKDGLREHKILAGQVQKWFHSPRESLSKLDDDKLYFLTESVYITTGIQLIDHREYFTPREEKEIITMFKGYKTDELTFPYTFKNAQKLPDGWTFLMSVTEARLLNNGAQIQYNPNVQRSSKTIKMDKETVIPVPKIFKSKIMDIKELFKKGKLRTTTLTFNARLGSSDEGEEVYFDEETGDLTITKGTLFDNIDGFHRLTATIQGQEENQEIDMPFMIKLSNDTDAGAKEEFTQINKVTPVHKAQRKKMDQEKFENYIVKYIEENSELRDKIVSDNTVGYKSQSLVSYSVFSDTIEDNFKIKNKGEAIKIGKFLTDFFNEICYTYPDEFLGDAIVPTKDVSLINANIMFVGYVTLASRFYKNNIDLGKLKDVLRNIDFSKSNKMWQKLKVVNEHGNLMNSSRKGIIKYFSEIKL